MQVSIKPGKTTLFNLLVNKTHCSSVADFFTTDITKQVLNVNGELLKALHWFFTHDIIVLPVWYVLLEKLCYGLAL